MFSCCAFVFPIYFLQARRRRGRTPTPGKYLGLRTVRGEMIFLFSYVGYFLMFMLFSLSNFKHQF